MKIGFPGSAAGMLGSLGSRAAYLPYHFYYPRRPDSPDFEWTGIEMDEVRSGIVSNTTGGHVDGQSAQIRGPDTRNSYVDRTAVHAGSSWPRPGLLFSASHWFAVTDTLK